jgi:hypothetical protein
MSSPQQNGFAMTPEMKAAIDKYIADETARILRASQPEQPKQLSVEETAHLLVTAASLSERGEKARPSSSGPTHERIIAALQMLVDKVFPLPVADDSATDDSTTESQSVAV